MMNTAATITSAAMIIRPNDLRTKYLPGAIVCGADGAPIRFPNVVPEAGASGIVTAARFSTNALGKVPLLKLHLFNAAPPAPLKDGEQMPRDLAAVAAYQGWLILPVPENTRPPEPVKFETKFGCDLFGVVTCYLGFLPGPEQRFEVGIVVEDREGAGG